ncbi:MAG TPA: hypothetical protein PL066_00250 [bacterium]|nr:hypothetical protein [bacterium]
MTLTANNFLHKNGNLNKFYLSVFLMTFGESLINIFVPIYLYFLGFSIFQILLFYFLSSVYFVVFSFWGSKITIKIGEKYAFLLSTPFLIAYYLGLIALKSYGVLFFVLPLLLSLRMIFFNYAYHLTYINHSQKHRQGRELAFLGILTLLATSAAPYLGSIIATFNFSVLFILSAVLMFVGAVPLLFIKEKRLQIDFSLKSLLKKFIDAKELGNLISFSGYAIESLIGRAIWPIFLIMVIGTLNKTGLIISLSMLISLLAYHFIGKLTDKIDKIKLLKIGTILHALAWLGRIFVNAPYQILAVDSYKKLSEKVLQLPWEAHSYDLARRENRFEFIVYREIVFNLIRIMVLPVLMVVFAVNFYPFTVSFAVAGIFSLGYWFIKK